MIDNLLKKDNWIPKIILIGIFLPVISIVAFMIHATIHLNNQPEKQLGVLYSFIGSIPGAVLWFIVITTLFS